MQCRYLLSSSISCHVRQMAGTWTVTVASSLLCHGQPCLRCPHVYPQLRCVDLGTDHPAVCFVLHPACRNEVRHQEYLERQAARAARDDVVKPKKFEHEVSMPAARSVTGCWAAVGGLESPTHT
jgi:hypothetical protein